MEEKTIRRILKTDEKNTCPVCKSKNLKFKEISFRNQAFTVLFCAKCKIPLANTYTCIQFRQATGKELECFSIDGSTSSGNVERIMYLNDYVSNLPIEKTVCKYKIVRNNYTVFKFSKNIIGTNHNIEICPKCRKKLENDYTLIPLDEYYRAKITGMNCFECNVIYVAWGKTVENLLKDNVYSGDFTFNNKKLSNYTENINKAKEEKLKEEERQIEQNRKMQAFSKYYSAVVMICIKYENGDSIEYIIVNDEKDADGTYSFDYRGFEGRELLSAAFAEEREKHGVFNNEKYEVLDCVFPDGDSKHIPETVIPTTRYINQDGGYKTSVRNANYEIIDVLWYSPFTGMYEIIRATYNHLTEECYTDIKLYKKFVNAYGNPGEIYFLKYGYYGEQNRWDNLNRESILKEFGYSVSQADGLSPKERQDILKDLVDLEILRVCDIINHLYFCINSHSDEKYIIACRKWKTDIEFMQNYKVNPNRFLIASEFKKYK